MTTQEFKVQSYRRFAEITARRTGNSKVWIADLWEAYGDGDRAQFERDLIEMNRNNELPLIRCDMTHTFDAALVAASEIRYGTATFHYVDTREMV